MIKFSLLDDDGKKIDAWITAGHIQCMETYIGAIGGHLKYWFIQTSLGLISGVSCLVCKADDLNLTDFDSW
jgi:hypothetical protein